MSSVLIINEGFSDNLGDQAIKESLEVLLKSKGYQTDFMYLSNPAITKLPAYSYDSDLSGNFIGRSFKKKLKTYLLFLYWFILNRKIIRDKLESNNYEKIIIGGGQLIISSGSFALSSFSIAIFWWVKLINRYSNARLYMVGVGTSKSFNFFEKLLYKNVFRSISRITVRDSFTKELLLKLFNEKSDIMPDVAFFRSDDRIKNSEIKKKGSLIGVTNYNEVYKRYNKGACSKEQYFDNLLKIYKHYIDKYGSVSIFYTTRTDAYECFEFKNFLSALGINVQVLSLSSLTHLEEALEKVQCVYSGRMHALILAKKFECEIEVFEISQKLKSFKEMYISSSISANEIDNELKEKFSESIQIK